MELECEHSMFQVGSSGSLACCHHYRLRLVIPVKSRLDSVDWVRRIIFQTFEIGALIRRDGRIRIISKIGIFLPSNCCNVVLSALAHVDISTESIASFVSLHQGIVSLIPAGASDRLLIALRTIRSRVRSVFGTGWLGCTAFRLALHTSLNRQ